MDDGFDDRGDWLGTPAACARLAVKPRDIYRLIDAGRLPAYRFGRVIRLRRSDVERFASYL